LTTWCRSALEARRSPTWTASPACAGGVTARRRRVASRRVRCGPRNRGRDATRTAGRSIRTTHGTAENRSGLATLDRHRTLILN
jgi:hypothetical protein